ncbi:unnamed protein product, partial [Mesorhabditis spiculigera]
MKRQKSNWYEAHLCGVRAVLSTNQHYLPSRPAPATRRAAPPPQPPDLLEMARESGVEMATDIAVGITSTAPPARFGDLEVERLGATDQERRAALEAIVERKKRALPKKE